VDPSILEQLILVISIGAVVAIVAHRLRIPYTVGLVLAGVIIAFLPLRIDLPLSKDFLFEVLLPPLIFEATLYIEWRELKRELIIVGAYATVGVLISASITAAIMHYFVGWPWPAAVIFGVLIAATDPVSIIATFKEAKVTGRLRLLVEAESLFNDSTAAVGFTVAVAFAAGDALGFSSTVWQLISIAGGGLVVGIVVALVALVIIGRTKDNLVELAMTTFAAFASFWTAEHFHLSGILATTAAGLVIGNRMTRGSITERGEESMEHFWEFAAFVANSVIFIILGINLAYQDFARASLAISVAICAVLAGRAAAVFPISAMFRPTALSVSGRDQNDLFWGGLRGALALALALGVPDTLPYKQEILLVTFGVVAFSVFVQATTITPLMRYLGILQKRNVSTAGPV
jgi:CPA1 family monovalent cation:H+ antiporter